MSENPNVKIGQVYRDKDKRMSSGNRHVLVVATNGGRLGNKIVCVPCYSDGRDSMKMDRAARHTARRIFNLGLN